MLDALIHRKLRGVLRESMRGRNHLELQEDLITSMIFGPLRFMPTGSAWHILTNLLLNETRSEEFKPTEHELHFWPNLKLGDGNTPVQPDLVFVFKSASDTKIFALEVKWKAPLGDRQLQKQCEAVSGKWGQRAVQILLSINPVNKEDEKAQVDETKCNATTWYGLMERLKNQFDTKIDTNVNYWTKQALELLEVLGIGSFSRFNDTPYIASIVTVLTWRIESWRFNASRWAMHLDGNSTTKALKWRVTP